MKTCKVERCSNKTHAKGYCNRCYYRAVRSGELVVSGVSLVEQLKNALAKVDMNYNEQGCWKWTGAIRGDYGIFTVVNPQSKTVNAHRFIYERLIDEVKAGLELDHYMYPQDGCIGPLCCNPGHLKPVPHRENALRSSGPTAINAKKTHCNRGHEFTEDNIYRTPSRPGERTCLICKRLRALGKL